MSDLQRLVRDGFINWEIFGDVRAVYKDDLVLFNYTHAAQFEGRWNWFERVSRGLILNAKTGEVVARPFDKFWNWGERDRTSDARLVSVTEKLDGSLGVLYRTQGQCAIATRGSFDSEQAEWASTELAVGYDIEDLPDSFTLLFEIIYPDNRIVVDYEGMQGLYLLAVRDRFTGKYLYWREAFDLAREYGFPVPKVHQFDSVEDIISAKQELDGNAEGWVAEFSDGQRFKFKGDRYLEIHRIVHAASFKRVLETVANGTYEETIAAVPDELLDEIREWKAYIDDTVAHIKAAVENTYARAPRVPRKTFALWVKGNRPELAPYLFRRLDGQDYTSLIYKLAFKEGVNG